METALDRGRAALCEAEIESNRLAALLAGLNGDFDAGQRRLAELNRLADAASAPTELLAANRAAREQANELRDLQEAARVTSARAANAARLVQHRQTVVSDALLRRKQLLAAIADEESRIGLAEQEAAGMRARAGLLVSLVLDRIARLRRELDELGGEPHEPEATS
jgi:hypothetical protein